MRNKCVKMCKKILYIRYILYIYTSHRFVNKNDEVDDIYFSFHVSVHLIFTAFFIRYYFRNIYIYIYIFNACVDPYISNLNFIVSLSIHC